jgi:imidazolonepropionase-like amidohydrolase
VREAHHQGILTACHAHSAEAIEQCLRFGVRSVEHGLYITPGQLNNFIEAGIYWVPTMCALQRLESVNNKFQEAVSQWRCNLRLAIEMGVLIAAGTDAGVPGLPHGSLPYEIDALISTGMTSLQALRAATLQNATMMGAEHQKGSIAEGMDADLVVFDGDITKPDFAFHRPDAVLKSGKLVQGNFPVAGYNRK